jgi:hypothetical protein
MSYGCDSWPRPLFSIARRQLSDLHHFGLWRFPNMRQGQWLHKYGQGRAKVMRRRRWPGTKSSFVPTLMCLEERVVLDNS